MKKVFAVFAALMLFIGIGAVANDGVYFGADYEFNDGVGAYIGYQWDGAFSDFALDFGFSNALAQTRSSMVFGAYYDYSGIAGDLGVDFVLNLDGTFRFQSIDLDGRYDVVLWPRSVGLISPYYGPTVTAYIECGVLITTLPGVPDIGGGIGFKVEY